MWTIRSNSSLDKKLKRLRSNPALIKAYKHVINRLSEAEDPAKLGKRPHGPYSAFYECRLSGSHRLVYGVDRSGHRVILYKVGDHKELFGRDNR